jgi:hypothetical protein
MAVKLKTLYPTAEEIPEGYADLYTERNGQFELNAVEGVKTQADIDRVNSALVKERNDHKVVKDQLTKVTAALGDIDPTTIPATLEELAEAKARLDTLTAEGKIDETKVTERIEAAVTRAVGPVKRDLDAAQRQLENERKKTAAKEAEVGALQGSIKQERIRTTIRDAAIAAKVIPQAIDDAVMVGERMFDYTDDGRLVTKDGVGVTPGLDPKEWAKDMMESRPHWWPPSVGGGSRGGPGSPPTGKDNPWSPEGWNVTAQGKVVREQGAEKAGAMAARVGSTLGATKPPKAKSAA